MEEWGQVLIKYYNKNNNIKNDDFTQNYLSYWTDNGLIYYYFFLKSKDMEFLIIFCRSLLLLVNRKRKKLSNHNIRFNRIF